MMKILVSVFLAIAAIFTLTMSIKGQPQNMSRNRSYEVFDDDWMEFKQRFNKKYNSSEEERLRKSIFQEQKRKIEQHNSLYEQNLTTFKLKMNQWGDIPSDEQIKKMEELLKNNSNELHPPEIRNTINIKWFEPKSVTMKIPDEIDWRKIGGVTPVQDQRSVCGSCWAFSAIGTLEGQYFRKTGNLTALSAQNLIDCTIGSSFGNYGCMGGSSISAILYAVHHGGLPSESQYLYKGKIGECLEKQTNKTVDNKTRKINIVFIKQGDESALKIAVATRGPLSAAIDAFYFTFDYYSEGIYVGEDCRNSTPNHMVLIVDYGTDSVGRDYWLVKNSYGKTWGEDGYLKIARNQPNQCGVVNGAFYPEV